MMGCVKDLARTVAIAVAAAATSKRTIPVASNQSLLWLSREWEVELAISITLS